jgi:hypothetical protein
VPERRQVKRPSLPRRTGRRPGGLAVHSSSPKDIRYSKPDENLNGATSGVYQALSTRNGGEVIRSDDF